MIELSGAPFGFIWVYLFGNYCFGGICIVQPIEVLIRPIFNRTEKNTRAMFAGLIRRILPPNRIRITAIVLRAIAKMMFNRTA